MKRFIAVSILALSIFYAAAAQPNFKPFYERNDFLFTSPGAMKFGLYGYDNPAVLSYIRQPDVLFTWSDRNASCKNLDHWGLFIGLPHIGFGTVHESVPAGRHADYNISFSTGDRTFSTGLSYGWTKTDVPSLDKTSILTSGYLFRPSPYLSAGVTWTEALNMKGHEITGELAGRPFGNEKITVFADYVMYRTPQLEKDMWSAGAAVEALPGLRITGRYFNTETFTLGVQFSLGHIGVETKAHYNSQQKHSYNSYGVRLGAYDRNVMDKLFPSKKNFVEMNQTGGIGYQRYALFDDSQVLIGLIENIEAAKQDPSVSGIAINTSGWTTDAEKLWELREKLKDFKTAGKKVFIFIDGGSIDLYHFASVADKIIMDPLGTFFMEGFGMGRTFYKGTLEKIGLGFDEWRFYKYKSAAENYSRDKMSDADREQRQKIVDDWYKIAKSDICESRHLTPEQFDRLVNNEVIFLAQQAKENGLVDSLGRWDKMKELVKNETGSDKNLVSAGTLLKFKQPYDNRWGEPPIIAVIYALGTCDMDEGITARKLVKDFESAADDPLVKAIVLRVDSPGGDAVASDYIAEAMKKVKGKKPIIVSQGYVAASGGYWLSMYADTIVAAPRTLTGSIGVIGGWFYNKGFKDSLGISTDFVKVGKHADIGFGMTLPLVGLTIPDRNLTIDERARAESLIKTMYKEFVDKVSLGRKQKSDDIESIAQGRVWSGLDGKQNGLVDILGGLETAINIAKERAGIPKCQEVTIIELPKKGLFDFSKFMPKLFSTETQILNDPAVELLKFRLKHNGEPLPMLPMEDIDMMRQSN